MKPSGVSLPFVIVIYIGVILISISLIVLKIWVVTSLLTSSVKSLSDDCAETYGIESYVSGDWFCPSNKEK